MKQADIVIAAAGKPQMITRQWLQNGAVLIDVGTNAVEDASRKDGYRLVGDKEFDSCVEVCLQPLPHDSALSERELPDNQT